jgi:site-specific DNA-methyltransferase (adenine-specific)
MERQIAASTSVGDVVWEPFGGLCSASVAAVRLGRDAYAAEINEGFHAAAMDRLNNEVASRERARKAG